MPPQRRYADAAVPHLEVIAGHHGHPLLCFSDHDPRHGVHTQPRAAVSTGQ